MVQQGLSTEFDILSRPQFFTNIWHPFWWRQLRPAYVLFWKLVGETQMPKPHRYTESFILIKELLLVGLRGLQSMSNPIKRPCILFSIVQYWLCLCSAIRKICKIWYKKPGLFCFDTSRMLAVHRWGHSCGNVFANFVFGWLIFFTF